jgi:hypothetical protein
LILLFAKVVAAVAATVEVAAAEVTAAAAAEATAAVAAAVADMTTAGAGEFQIELKFRLDFKILIYKSQPFLLLQWIQWRSWWWRIQQWRR